MEQTDLKTDSRREQLVFGNPIDWDGDDVSGGIALFGDHYDDTAIDVETARTLVDEGYVHPNGRQNSSPQFVEMVAWGERTEAEYDVTVEFEGYVVSPNRGDARVSFTRIVVWSNEGAFDVSLVAELGEKFGRADETHIGEETASFWWD